MIIPVGQDDILSDNDLLGFPGGQIYNLSDNNLKR
jgi:hypothetical protein